MFDQPTPPPTGTALTVSAARLRNLCKQLAPAWVRRSTIPILSCVRLQVTPSGTTLTTTDLDLTIRIFADDIASPEPFDTCVDFALLRNIAGSIDGPLSITYAPATDKARTARLTITTDDGTEVAINLTFPGEDFPILPDTLDDPLAWHTIDMTTDDLHRMINLSFPCVSTEETRYYLNGIHLCRKPDAANLRAVATDGYRLAVIDTPCAMPDGITAIVPTVAIRAITGIIGKRGNTTAHLMLHHEAPRMRLVNGQITIDCKLIVGEFPDYTRVIPKAEIRSIVNVTATALRQLMPMYDSMTYGAKFHDGKVTLVNLKLGSISAPAPMLHLPQDPAEQVREISFNLSFLMTQGYLTPTMRMALTAPDDPARITGPDPDALWLLMPMRV